MSVDWKMTPTVLGLSVLSVSPGIAGIKNDPTEVDKAEQMRALTETVVLGLLAVHITKSWWPLAGPIAYLSYDYYWREMRNPRKVVEAWQLPEVG